jgi:hypothetical protein
LPSFRFEELKVLIAKLMQIDGPRMHPCFKIILDMD